MPHLLHPRAHTVHTVQAHPISQLHFYTYIAIAFVALSVIGVVVYAVYTCYRSARFWETVRLRETADTDEDADPEPRKRGNVNGTAYLREKNGERESTSWYRQPGYEPKDSVKLKNLILACEDVGMHSSAALVENTYFQRRHETRTNTRKNFQYPSPDPARSPTLVCPSPQISPPPRAHPTHYDRNNIPFFSPTAGYGYTTSNTKLGPMQGWSGV